MALVFCFGDSLMYGIGDSIAGGWVSRLTNNFVSEKKFHTVYNLGVRGNMSFDVLQRIESEIKSRNVGLDSSVSLIQIGLNDSKKPNGTDLGIFKKNILQIIILLNKLNSTPVFLTIPPVDEIALLEHNISDFQNENISCYNEVIVNVSQSKKVLCIDINETFKSDSALLGGVHPNSKGYEAIFKLVDSSLEDYLK